MRMCLVVAVGAALAVSSPASVRAQRSMPAVEVLGDFGVDAALVAVNTTSGLSPYLSGGVRLGAAVAYDRYAVGAQLRIFQLAARGGTGGGGIEGLVTVERSLSDPSDALRAGVGYAFTYLDDALGPRDLLGLSNDGIVVLVGASRERRFEAGYGVTYSVNARILPFSRGIPSLDIGIGLRQHYFRPYIRP
jgi:hypothetical protein